MWPLNGRFVRMENQFASVRFSRWSTCLRRRTSMCIPSRRWKLNKALQLGYAKRVHTLASRTFSVMETCGDSCPYLLCRVFAKPLYQCATCRSSTFPKLANLVSAVPPARRSVVSVPSNRPKTTTVLWNADRCEHELLISRILHLAGRFVHKPVIILRRGAESTNSFSLNAWGGCNFWQTRFVYWIVKKET